MRDAGGFITAWIPILASALAVKMRRRAQHVHDGSLRSTIAAAREEKDRRARDALYIQHHLGEHNEVARDLRSEAADAANRLIELEKKENNSR